MAKVPPFDAQFFLKDIVSAVRKHQVIINKFSIWKGTLAPDRAYNFFYQICFTSEIQIGDRSIVLLHFERSYVTKIEDIKQALD